MPDPKTRPEVAAIGAMLDALEPLDEHARINAIHFVLTQLKISIGGLPSATVLPEHTPFSLPTPESAKHPQHAPAVVDIRMLKETKQPRSANEMAALVAYYLQYEAPPGERKETINTKDINRYFDQAKYPLPASSAMTLTNSKNAGYLDSAGRNQFKLNAVGYNLVVHRLPASSDAPAGRSRRTNKATRKRASQKKKAR